MVDAVAPARRTGAWAGALTLIRAGDVPGTERYVSGLGPSGRAAIAAELPGHVARTPGLGRQATPLLLAGAACLSEPADVVAWLFRPELRQRADDDRGGVASQGRREPGGGEPAEGERVLRLLRRRSLEWQADVASRIASRLRPPGLRHWGVAAALVRELGLEPPGDLPFVAGWLRSMRAMPPGAPADDPLCAAYAPRLLDFDGLTHADRWLLVGAVMRLVEDGLLTRASVLDGLLTRLAQAIPITPAPTDRATRDAPARSVRPFHRAHDAPDQERPDALACAARLPDPLPGAVAVSGRIGGPPRFGGWRTPDELPDPRTGRLTPAQLVSLHDRLGPTLDESAAHAPAYVRLLPAHPVVAADMAVTQLWRLEEAGRLDEALFARALRALTSRPEKRLLRVAVDWAGEATLRDASRADGVLEALTPVLRQDTPALRERAARLAARLAPPAGPGGQAAALLPTHQSDRLCSPHDGLTFW
ncbi:hypothetical protein AB0K18_36200 [Nonomuraea sp. NPDC049421]|uniref:hypothetical protein n=1 Tax=Nonomuraea sp. NPDC049421 TaxID=3155275 RepID=UPI00342D6B16